MPTDESKFLHKLEVEVEAELVVAESSESEETFATSPTEWLFDPADIEREEVGLRNLLGAVEALELDSAVVLEDEGNAREVRMITEAELADTKADGMDADAMRVPRRDDH